MRILHVMSRLPVGGVENQLLLLLRNYDRNKCDITVCSLADEGENGRKIRELGIRLICLNKLDHGFDRSMVRDLMRIMQDGGVDVVRTHQYHANLYGRIAAWRAKVPCIVPSVHNVYTRDRKIHRRMLNRILGSISDRIVAVSGAVKSDIMTYDGLPADKIQVVYNGVDAARFRNAEGTAIRAEFSIPEQAAVVGSVGRLSYQKGQKFLVDALSLLVKENPELIALIVGDGPERAGLEKRAAEKGIRKNVIFTGTRDDVPNLLAAMDLFVFPSFWEGMPNALVEAMTAGKPIIASGIEPNREVLGPEGAGIIVPTEDSTALAAAMSRLLADRQLAAGMGKAAQERALSQFDIRRTVSAYMDLFEGILRRKGRWQVQDKQ